MNCPEYWARVKQGGMFGNAWIRRNPEEARECPKERQSRPFGIDSASVSPPRQPHNAEIEVKFPSDPFEMLARVDLLHSKTSNQDKISYPSIDASSARDLLAKDQPIYLGASHWTPNIFRFDFLKKVDITDEMAVISTEGELRQIANNIQRSYRIMFPNMPETTQRVMSNELKASFNDK